MYLLTLCFTNVLLFTAFVVGSTYTTDRTGGPAGIVSNRDSHLVVRGSSEVGKRQSLGTHQLLRILGVSTNFLQLNSMWKKGALSSKEQRQRYKRHADEGKK